MDLDFGRVINPTWLMGWGLQQQQNTQRPADLTCTMDKTDVKFRGVAGS
jgi:hypothetical protein